MGIVQLKNVSKDFCVNNSIVKVVSGLNLQIKEKKFVSFVGKSGCGKTTILKLIAGLIKPSCGEVVVNSFGSKFEGNFGFIFQKPTLFFWKNIYQNVSFPLEVVKSKKSLKEKKEKIEHVINLVGLWDFKYFLPNQLSLGMQQKVALARALVTDPEYILMDEPFASIDEISREKLNDELLNLWHEAGATIIFVTHSLREAVYLSQEVVVLSGNPTTVKKVVKIDSHSLSDKVNEIRCLLDLDLFL
jgi:NitT/TauT family transport system ATP-binding protein